MSPPAKRRAVVSESRDTTEHYRLLPTPPDGGYGWVVVLASFMNHVIVDGIAFTFGVFYTDFLEYFQEGKGKTSLVGSLLAGCYLLTAPFASAMVNRFGCRAVAISGSIIASVGFVASTFSTNIDVLLFTYGVIGGVGLGLLYLPNIVAVSYYFERRRAVATGMAVCGAGVGCFVFAPAGRWLLDTYDWKNAMLVVAGITLNGCVFGALLRPMGKRRVRVAVTPVVEVKSEVNTVNEKGITEDATRLRSDSTSSWLAHKQLIIQRLRQLRTSPLAALKSTEARHRETNDPEVKDTEFKDAEVKDTEFKDAEVKDTKIKETDVKEAEFKINEIKKKKVPTATLR